MLRRFSIWHKVKLGPPDPIHELGFEHSPSPRKVDLALGMYRNEDGQTWTFPCIRQARSTLLETSHEQSDEDFLSTVRKFLYQDYALEGHLAGIQTLGGTGALRVAFEFVKQFYPHDSTIYLPNSCTPIYPMLLNECNLPWKGYPYYNIDKNSLDPTRLYEYLDTAPRFSVFVFQAAGHDPSGFDLTPAQWKIVQDLTAQHQHLVILDDQYHGLVSGSLVEDAFPLKLFLHERNPLIHAYSFSHNLGIYGERTGLLTVSCDGVQDSERVSYHLERISSALVGSCPLYGARLVTSLLNSQQLVTQWEEDLMITQQQISQRRQWLVQALKMAGSHRNWNFLKEHKGWYGYTGLTPDQVERLAKIRHIFLQLDGRLAVTGLNRLNVEYVAESIDEVTRFFSE